MALVTENVLHKEKDNIQKQLVWNNWFYIKLSTSHYLHCHYIDWPKPVDNYSKIIIYLWYNLAYKPKLIR